MKAWALRKFGGPEALELLELPIPTLAGPHDILVKLHAAAINPVDAKIRYQKGSTEALANPRILGYDGSGVVVKLGTEAKLFKEGDEVYFSGLVSRNGSNAQFIAVDERIVGRKPKNLSWEQAAAEPLTLITAWESLFEGMHLPLGHSVTNKSILIINGAGGVGTSAIQLAKLVNGLKVIATASRPETIDICKGYGADHVIDHRKPLKDGLQSIGLAKVDYILNCFEADEHWEQIKTILNPFGTIVCMTTRKPIDVAWGQPLRANIVWEFMFARPMHNVEPEKQHALLNKAAELFEGGKLKSRLTEVKKWADLRELHAFIESSAAIGKYAFAVPQ